MTPDPRVIPEGEAFPGHDHTLASCKCALCQHRIKRARASGKVLTSVRPRPANYQQGGMDKSWRGSGSRRAAARAEVVELSAGRLRHLRDALHWHHKNMGTMERTAILDLMRCVDECLDRREGPAK